MSLNATMKVRRGEFSVEAALNVGAGETIALIGPNGSGKSTIVGVLAGIIPLELGEIRLSDRVLESSRDGIRLPPQRRSVGVVFQDRLLFPNMSARENVAFGLRAGGMAAGEARAIADEWLDRMGLSRHHDRRPGELSGGEAQRVALARALVVEPDLLLLDEPLSSLDVAARASMKRLMRDVLRDYSGVKILITHDPVEALSMAGRVIVLEGGRIIQEGRPDEVTRRPRSDYAASMVGRNIVQGVIAREEDRTLVRGGGGALQVGSSDIEEGAEVIAAIHPRSVVISLELSRVSLRNHLKGTIETIDDLGDRSRVRIGSSPPLIAEVTRTAIADLGLREGLEVWASVKAMEIEVYRR